ncbi:hypothetical protein HZA38_04970 [Candidatus Peregrinibacteria bacterium]|nr:hypothetical protein [Candidatus Peregrinibacteria bacterium]
MEDQENTLQANLETEENSSSSHEEYHSHIARHFSIAGALFGFLLLFSTVFANTPSPVQYTEFPELDVREGSILKQEAFDKEYVSVTKTALLSGNTLLFSDSNSESTISIPDIGEVRIKGETVTNTHFSSQIPLFELEKGEMWVFGFQKINVAFQKYIFQVENGSADFVNDGDHITVTTWENTLSVRILGNRGENDVETFLPPMSKAVFSLQNPLKNEILAKLRYSKLLREFRVEANQESYESSLNLERDNALRKEYSEKIFQKKEDGEWVVKKALQYLSLFPEKRKVRDEEMWKTQKKIFFTALQENDRLGIQQFFLENEPTQNELADLLKDIKFVEKFLPDKTIRHTLEDKLGVSFVSSAARDFELEILKSAFYGLQQSFEKSEKFWRNMEIQRIQDIWNWQEHRRNTWNSFHPHLLTLYRETLFRLFLKNSSEVTQELLTFLTFLDDEELTLTSDEERQITELEILQRGLVLAKSFVDIGKPLLAHSVLQNVDARIRDRSDTLLSFVAFQNITQTKKEIETRLHVCEFYGNCSYDAYQKWIQTRRLMACELSGVCDENGFQEWLDASVKNGPAFTAPPEVSPENSPESPKDNYEEARKILELADIRLENGKRIDEEFFQIQKAVMADGTVFTGLLSLPYRYIKEVELEDTTKIQGTHSLPSLKNAIYRTLHPEVTVPEPKTKEGQEAVQKTEEMDPVIADLVIRNLQPALLEAGLTVLRTDMFPMSITAVHVEYATVGTEKVEVSFDYTMKKETGEKILEHVKFKEYPSISLEEVSLIEAAKKIRDLAKEAASREDVKGEIISFFKAHDIKVDAGSLRFSDDEMGIIFTGATDSQKEVQLSGIIDIKTQILLEVSDANGILKDAANISLEEYLKQKK